MGIEEIKDNKRNLIGVMFFAWSIIIIASFSFYYNQIDDEINSSPSVIFYNIICPVSVVAAFFLLRLKNWARISIIIINLLLVFENIITISYALIHAPERSVETMVIVFLVIIYTFTIIYYFNRPKVKALFK